MSDVEKTTSGEICEKSTAAASKTTTATATTVSSASTAAEKAVRLQQQQQQQQRQHYSQQHSHHHSHYPEKAAAVNNVEAENSATLVEHADDISAHSTPSLGHHCLSHVLKAVFSTPGLVLLVILYSIMGALLFPLLEAPQDITKSVAIAKSREDCLRELWIITEKLNVLYERNWTMLVHEQLRRFEGSIVAATRHGGLSVTNAGLGNNALAGRIGGQMDALLDARWTFSEALLYSVTVITTIGHGSLTPKTSAGKVATILYALIGVPLMLMCLSSLGALLAEALQCTYARICCRLARSGRGNAQQNSASRQRCESVDGVDEGDVGGRAKTKEVDQHHNHHQHHHHSEFTEQTHELNCKSCKYDAVIGETNLNNSYNDYKNVNGASMARAEESCQLLHNSSMSVNHVSPCMQLKSATMGTNVQYYQQRANNAYLQQQQQQQQHQQQHSHQHSDVMHMSSACAEATTASNSSLLSQKFSQPSTATPNYCSRSATPSPQHLQHPLQQNYHIVTSSTHSSPTHTGGYVRQNPMQQHHLQQQQHFVAVPSNVVRYQTTVAPAGAATAVTAPLKGEMLNFYQPASVAVTGSATIYFPISAAAPATTTTVAATAPHGTQLLYNQPLVKYHTIQLQHKKPPSYVVADATVAVAASASQGQVTFATGTITTTASCGTVPLPPPPAYQTATVHGFRRAKFLTKPMAQGVNTLIAEQDLGCRHDMSQHCNTSSAEPPAATAASATQGAAQTTLSTTLSAPSSCAATITATTTNTTRGVVFGMATTAATMPTTSLSHAASVDIMEDEEENEQHRMGNCPHGTPSRVPLISGAGNSENAYSSDGKAKEGGNAKSSSILSRGLMNSTAASFHRHTLHTFHRSGNRKSTMARRSCTLHRTNAGRGGMLSSSSGGCYGDTTETSDDDDYLAHGSTDFVLNGGPDEEQEEEESEDDATCERRRVADGPQVPITIVLLILICYICLGTVIFAFWENWSLIDGAYFCFVTLSTIGYGDFLPERTFNGPEVQLFACCAYLLLGLVLVAMSFSILETQLMWKCKRIAVRLKLAKD